MYIVYVAVFAPSEVIIDPNWYNENPPDWYIVAKHYKSYSGARRWKIKREIEYRDMGDFRMAARFRHGFIKRFDGI